MYQGDRPCTAAVMAKFVAERWTRELAATHAADAQVQVLRGRSHRHV